MRVDAMKLYIPHSSDKTSSLDYLAFLEKSFTSHIVQIKLAVLPTSLWRERPLHPT